MHHRCLQRNGRSSPNPMGSLNLWSRHGSNRTVQATQSDSSMRPIARPCRLHPVEASRALLHSKGLNPPIRGGGQVHCMVPNGRSGRETCCVQGSRLCCRKTSLALPQRVQLVDVDQPKGWNRVIASFLVHPKHNPSACFRCRRLHRCLQGFP